MKNPESFLIAFFLSHSIQSGREFCCLALTNTVDLWAMQGLGALTSRTVKNPYTISASKTKDWLVTHPGARNWNSLDRIRTQTLKVFWFHMLESNTNFPPHLEMCRMKIQVLYLLKKMCILVADPCSRNLGCSKINHVFRIQPVLTPCAAANQYKLQFSPGWPQQALVSLPASICVTPTAHSPYLYLKIKIRPYLLAGTALATAPLLIRIEVSSPTGAYKALHGLALCSLSDLFLVPSCSVYPRHAGLPVGSEKCHV